MALNKLEPQTLLMKRIPNSPFVGNMPWTEPVTLALKASNKQVLIPQIAQAFRLIKYTLQIDGHSCIKKSQDQN